MCCAAGTLLLFASTSPARAGSFAPDGSFLLDQAAAAIFDFEEAGDPDGGLAPMADPGSLSGGSTLPLTALKGVNLTVALPATRRSYRFSAWVRGGELEALVSISYTDRASEVAALYPTGRVTSDGWVEVAADHVRVDGPRLKLLRLNLFAATAAAVDAVEVVPDGGAIDFPAQPNAPCAGITEAGVCASDQLCLWSECRNVGGWVPRVPVDRDAVADYLAARIHLLFGPYLERTVDMPAVDVALDQMRHAKDRYGYWNGFATAIRRLHDGHTTTDGPDSAIRNPRPLSICFLEGDADLSHGAAPKDPEYLDVLVSHVGNDHNLGLRQGDRLVSVDGMHPIAWARSLVSVNWGQPGISNHTTFAELASSLGRTISKYAQQIEVVRCDGNTSTCGSIEAISIGAIPPDPATMMTSRVSCDNRPLRHVPGAPGNHSIGEKVYSGLVNESTAAEKIYGLEWESLFTTDGVDGVGAGLNQATATWALDARGVILDHRTGNGGTVLGPAILWDFAILQHPDDLYVDRAFAEEEQPAPADAAARFNAALNTSHMLYVGGGAPHTDVPVAILLTEDVSASDWLPQGMKGGQHVRTFGPFQTNGAFSTRFVFGYWGGIGHVMAVGDDILPDGSTHNGRGVDPDVVVLPRQSDLVIGKDSVFEAALAWVRQELKP